MKRSSQKLSMIQLDKRGSQRRITYNSLKEINEEFLQDTAQANIEVAQLYKQKWELKDPANKQKYPMCVDSSEFGRYGIGLRLFFEFLKFTSILFFIMALISIPSMYSNGSGKGLEQNYSSEANSFGALTIANQPELLLVQYGASSTDDEKAAIDSQNTVKINDYVKDMKERQYWLVIPDLVYTALFVGFIYYWRSRSRSIEKESLKKEAMPSHYTIYIKGFPSEITDYQPIKEHFSQFGEIQGVYLVRNYFGTLFHHKKEADILHKINIEKKRIQMKGEIESKKLVKLEEKLVKVQNDIHIKTSEKLGDVVSHDKYPSLGAYVVFSKISDKYSCIEAFDNNNSCCGVKDKRCYYKGKLLKIREKVDEPSNIKWENLDVSTSERIGRVCVVLFLVLIVMLLTFIIIFVANIVKPSSSTYCPATTYSYSEAKDSNDKTIKTCFCKSQSLSTLQTDQDIQNYCWDIYVEYVSLTLIAFATAVIVIFVNFLLKILLRALGRFSKYTTLTKETLGITVFLFVAMFVNTAIITLLLQAEIFGWTPAISLTAPIPPLQQLQQDNATEFSPDFDRAWYVEVGAKITITMLISIISPHLLFWCLIPCYRRSRKSKAKKQVIQRDMNNFITGPQFQVTSYYSQALNIIFVTMFYSSGIPLLLLFASISLGIQYWVYKYNILRYNKRPPTYDTRLNKQVISLLPFAAIFHLLASVYMYGSPLIFPLKNSTIKIETSSNINFAKADAGIDTIPERIEKSLIMFIALLVVVTIVIIDNTLWALLKKLYESLCINKKQKNNFAAITPSGNQKENQKQKQFGTYKEEYENMKARMICNYDIRLNEEYSNLIRAIEVGKEDHEKQVLATATERDKQTPRNDKIGTPNNAQHQKRKNSFSKFNQQ